MMRTLRRLSRLAVLLFVGVVAFALYDRYAPAPTPPPLAPLTEQIDHILIEKSARQMTVFRGGEIMRTDLPPETSLTLM